jgi:flagellar biosynthetic protein FliQ
MGPNDIGTVMEKALYTVLVVGGPIVLVTMGVGLVISVLQAATQIHEATLTFVPKLVVTALLLVFFGSYMVAALTDFTRFVFAVAAESAR